MNKQERKKKRIRKTIICPDCAGTGIDNWDSSMYCPLCDGKKRIPISVAKQVDLSLGKSLKSKLKGKE